MSEVMVSDEEQLRYLQASVEGVDPDVSATFLEVRYEVATRARLAPLLRYAALGQRSARERARLESLGEAAGEAPTEQAGLAAAHWLLEDCLADFRAFSEAAIAGKALAEDIHTVVERIVEVLTARPALAGLRLLRHVASNLAELDGRLLLAGGRGIAALSVREVCNAAYAKMLDEVDPERRAEWIESLYLDYSPEERALEMVRQMQAARAAEKAAAEKEAGDGGHPVG